MNLFLGVVWGYLTSPSDLRCNNQLQTSQNTLRYCYGRAPSYYQISGQLYFSGNGNAAVFLKSAGKATELRVDVTMKSETGGCAFSIFGIGVSLRMENVSFILASTKFDQISGGVPFSADTSIRNGRLEVTNNVAKAYGLAERLTGYVKLDSFSIKVDAFEGAALGEKALSLSLICFHCLLEESLQAGGVIFAAIRPEFRINTWVDSQYVSSQGDGDFGKFVKTPEEICSFQMVSSKNIPLSGGQVPCDSVCQGLNITLINYTLSSPDTTPLQAVAEYNFVQIHGKVVQGDIVSLISQESARQINCLKITASVVENTSKFAFVLYRTTSDVKVTSFILNSTQSTSQTQAGFAAFQEVYNELQVTNVMLQGSYNAVHKSALLVNQITNVTAVIYINKVLATLNSYSFGDNSSVLIQAAQEAHLYNINISFVQNDGASSSSSHFGGLLQIIENEKSTISKVAANFTYASLDNSGVLVQNCEKAVKIDNIKLVVEQAKQCSSDTAPLFVGRGVLSNFTVYVSYDNTWYSSSIIYTAYNQQVFNCSVSGNANASKLNQMALMLEVCKKIVIGNVTCWNFRQKAGYSNAMVAVYSYDDIQVYNITAHNAVINSTNSRLGSLVSWLGGYQTHAYVNVSLDGLINNLAKAANTSLLVGSSGQGADVTVANSRILFEVEGILSYLFGYFGDNSELALKNTALDVNQIIIPCFGGFLTVVKDANYSCQ